MSGRPMRSLVVNPSLGQKGGFASASLPGRGISFWGSKEREATRRVQGVVQKEHGKFTVAEHTVTPNVIPHLLPHLL